MNRLLIPGVVVGMVVLTCAASRTAMAADTRDTIPPALAPWGTEHDDLHANFGVVLRVATAPNATRADRLALVTFLRNAVLPHAQDEELVLYPALDSVLGARGSATATLVLDHRAIADRTLELVTLVDGDPALFQRQAVAVGALIDHHFTVEEEFVYPNLARRMGNRAQQALMRRMQSPEAAP
jgi:hemerythrin-like domain-containing protein